MHNEITILSLELLLLNDLLHTNAIDKTIYDKAAERIISKEKETQSPNTSQV